MATSSRQRSSARKPARRASSAGKANAKRGNSRNQRRGAAKQTRTQSASRPVVPQGRRVRVSPRAKSLLRIGAKLGLAVGMVYGAVFGAHEAYDYATTSPRFEVRSLIYQPTQHVDDDTMRGLLGLERGTNILALEPELLAEQVATHPWISDALVLRHLPDTLEVRITERKARAVAMIDGFFLIDEQGRPFKRVASRERGSLPIITGVDRAEMLQDPEAAQARLRSALDAVSAYQEKQRPRLSEVHLEGESGMSLYTAESGTHLRFGRNSVRRGLARYDALRAALGARAEQLEVVHLDAEVRPGARDRVVARFADEATEQAVIAEAAAAEYADGSTPALDAEAAAAAPEPLGRTPKARRIPRY